MKSTKKNVSTRKTYKVQVPMKLMKSEHIIIALFSRKHHVSSSQAMSRTRYMATPVKKSRGNHEHWTNECLPGSAKSHWKCVGQLFLLGLNVHSSIAWPREAKRLANIHWTSPIIRYSQKKNKTKNISLKTNNFRIKKVQINWRIEP